MTESITEKDIVINRIVTIANDLRLKEFASVPALKRMDTESLKMLEGIMRDQQVVTHHNRLINRLNRAGINVIKTFDTFELSEQRFPNLDLSLVDELQTLDFVREHNDFVAIGPPGAGKTHLALATGYEAVRQGMWVKFRTAQQLIHEYEDAKSEKRQKTFIEFMSKPDLLIIDEMGYLNYDASSAKVLYQIVSSRYEKKSIFYTSNKEFTEWAEFLGDTDMARGVASRVAHHSLILNMVGAENWRLEHALSRNRNRKHEEVLQ